MRTWMLVPLAAVLGCAHPQQQTASTPSAPIAGAPMEQTVACAPAPTSCQAVRVFFEFNSSLLSDENKGALDLSAACLKDHPSTQIVIAGNTDRVGTEEYNLALGQARAQAVAGYLESKGVNADQLKAVSHGKDRLICEGTSADCDAHNRRAALTICHM